MKQFFESYGGVALGILALLVLIAMITPVGNIIKTSLQGTTNKFASSMNGQLDDAMVATAEAQKNAEHEPNPFRDKIMSLNTLYDIGERNLTNDDIVNINGIDCYILKVEDNKAKFITKEIYDVRFDEGGHNSEDVEGHVGPVGYGYGDKTYDYKYSTLRTWMSDFYINQLGSDTRIIPTNVSYYTNGSLSNDLSVFTIGTLENEYVSALDASEFTNNKTKFGWDQTQTYDKGFWITAGSRASSWPGARYALYSGSWANGNVGSENAGARPVFWISLE